MILQCVMQVLVLSYCSNQLQLLETTFMKEFLNGRDSPNPMEFYSPQQLPQFLFVSAFFFSFLATQGAFYSQDVWT